MRTLFMPLVDGDTPSCSSKAGRLARDGGERQHTGRRSAPQGERHALGTQLCEPLMVLRNGICNECWLETWQLVVVQENSRQRERRTARAEQRKLVKPSSCDPLPVEPASPPCPPAPAATLPSFLSSFRPSSVEKRSGMCSEAVCINLRHTHVYWVRFIFFAPRREVVEYRKNDQERGKSMKAKKNERERSQEMRAS